MLQTGTPVSLTEADYHCGNGVSQRWKIRIFPCPDSFERPAALVQIHDVSERDSLWRHLVDTDKMAGLGTLTAFVAHEFNNLIGGVQGFAQLAQLSRKEEDYQRTIEVVYQVSQRVKRLAAELLALSMPHGDKEDTVPLVKLVDSLLVLLERRFNKQNVTVVKEIDPTLLIRTNPIRLQQVLLQILLNARTGLMAGGELRIQGGLDAQGRPRLIFEDNGVSIPPDRLARLYEVEIRKPGTAAENDRAAGAGFAISRQVLGDLGGELAVRERSGGGCTVEVLLPATAVCR